MDEQAEEQQTEHVQLHLRRARPELQAAKRGQLAVERVGHQSTPRRRFGRIIRRRASRISRAAAAQLEQQLHIRQADHPGQAGERRQPVEQQHAYAADQVVLPPAGVARAGGGRRRRRRAGGGWRQLSLNGHAVAPRLLQAHC
eukprot:scaffold20430_cov51-Isochrysis_galbana.AAC.1